MNTACVDHLLKGVSTLTGLFERLCRRAVCVFLYHDISDHPSRFSQRYRLNVPPAMFERQLAMIRQWFHLIHPDELLAGDYPTPAALVTFDDGMPGYFERAVPILEQLRCPSVVFLNMGPVDGEVFWPGLVDYLWEHEAGFRGALSQGRGTGMSSMEALQCSRSRVDRYLEGSDHPELFREARASYGGFATRAHLEAVAGHPDIALGNHLYNHYNVATLTQTELHDAYLKNREALAGYSNAVEWFAYPFGQPQSCYTDQTDAWVYGLGAKVLFSAYPLPNYDATRRFFHRIPLHSGVVTEDAFKYAIVRPWLAHRARRLMRGARTARRAEGVGLNA